MRWHLESNVLIPVACNKPLRCWRTTSFLTSLSWAILFVQLKFPCIQYLLRWTRKTDGVPTELVLAWIIPMVNSALQSHGFQKGRMTTLWLCALKASRNEAVGVWLRLLHLGWVRVTQKRWPWQHCMKDMLGSAGISQIPSERSWHPNWRVPQQVWACSGLPKIAAIGCYWLLVDDTDRTPELSTQAWETTYHYRYVDRTNPVNGKNPPYEPPFRGKNICLSTVKS